MKASELLAKIGGTLWMILLGGFLIMWLLHWLEVIDARQFDWRMFTVIFGVGGLLALVLAGIAALWEDKD
ncbi:MAG: hypothetical protein ACWA44_12280 [Thiotrichales bacterium]